jgi:hypothetical protein
MQLSGREDADYRLLRQIRRPIRAFVERDDNFCSLKTQNGALVVSESESHADQAGRCRIERPVADASYRPNDASPESFDVGYLVSCLFTAVFLGTELDCSRERLEDHFLLVVACHGGSTLSDQVTTFRRPWEKKKPGGQQSFVYLPN